jgi:ferredoxin
MCANAAPDLFAVGESDGYAYLKVESGDTAGAVDHLRTADINDSERDAATLAASVCPMEAIEILEE